MSYVIEPMTLVSFLDETKMKLPRFQRKATWTSKQNFELCISVFQEYPVGVVIVNKENNVSWLLDGRQRRNALTLMRKNPIELYLWAQSYLKFNRTADSTEVTNIFWSKIAKYLQTEKIEDSEGSSDNRESSLYEGEEDVFENSFKVENKREGLNTLLDIIQMVHQIKRNRISSWESHFDYRDFFTKLKYGTTKNGISEIDPTLLREFILQLKREFDKEFEGKVTKEYFIKYYYNLYHIEDKDIKNFEEMVERYWREISHSFNVIERTEKIFTDARIGLIELRNASPLDAQNIFSMINSGGTQLKAEELLSAKPFWNIKVDNSSKNVTDKVEDLYKRLELPRPTMIVRWDLPAILISRVDEFNLIFEDYASSKKKKEVSMDEITLGFKLISSIYNNGMSSKHVSDLEDNKEINWESDIDELVDNLNTMIRVLMQHNFFRTLQTWNMPITKMLGNAIGLEFITILYKNWKYKNSPTVSSNELKAFQRDSIILFDKLVYEYSTKVWRGSGDSKMANDIKDWINRIKPVSTKEWLDFIKEACVGEYNGSATTVKILRPILYYSYVLNQSTPRNQTDIVNEVDHIIPKEKLQNNSMVDPKFENSLSNLTLLSKKDNISKKSKALNEITDLWLKETITLYTGIEESEFDDFSDATNSKDLQKKRTEIFVNTFESIRNTQLSN